jgi:hypothetical protein
MQRSLALLVTLVFVSVTSSLRGQPVEMAVGGGYDFGRSSLKFERADSTTLWLQSLYADIAAPSVSARVSVPIDSGLRLCMLLSANQNSTELTAPAHEVYVMFPEPPTSSIEERIYFTSYQLTGAVLVDLEVAGGLSIAMGPTIGYRFITDYQHLRFFYNFLDLGPPANWQRVPIGSPEEVTDPYRPLRDQLCIGMLLRASYAVPLSSHLSIVPELRIVGDIISLPVNPAWRSLAIGGGLLVCYEL